MNPITKNIWRFVLLLLLQVLVFRQMQIQGLGFNYVQILIYPLFILLLPVDISKSWLLILGFLMGLAVDMFYDSPGLHASASVLLAFIRPIVLHQLEPRGGYKVNSVPTRNEFGDNWFYRYASILLGVHLLAYFMLEAFQLSMIGSVLIKTITSLVASLLIVGLYMLIFNPKA
jgi:hypothetical protein